MRISKRTLVGAAAAIAVMMAGAVGVQAQSTMPKAMHTKHKTPMKHTMHMKHMKHTMHAKHMKHMHHMKHASMSKGAGSCGAMMYWKDGKCMDIRLKK